MKVTFYFTQEQLGIKEQSDDQENFDHDKAGQLIFSRSYCMYYLVFTDMALEQVQKFLKRIGIKPQEIELEDHVANCLGQCGRYEYGESKGIVDSYYIYGDYDPRIEFKILLRGTNVQSIYEMYEKIRTGELEPKVLYEEKQVKQEETTD